MAEPFKLDEHAPIPSSPEEIRAEIDHLSILTTKARADTEKAVKELKATAPYLKLKKQCEMYGSKTTELTKQMDKIENKVWEKLLMDVDRYTRPYYHEHGRRTNILEDVLRAVRMNFKIALLRDEDVCQIVSRLHRMMLDSTNFFNLSRKRGAIGEFYDALQEKMRDMERELNNPEWVYSYERRIRRLQEALSRPDLRKVHDERETERSRATRVECIAAVHQSLLQIRRQVKP